MGGRRRGCGEPHQGPRWHRRRVPAGTEAGAASKLILPLPLLQMGRRRSSVDWCAAQSMPTLLPPIPPPASRHARSTVAPLVPRGPFDPPPANATAPSVFLYAWAGNDNPGPACRDALVALDATPESPHFGQIVNIAFTPTWGNEPHHVRGWGGGEAVLGRALLG